jgi:hypothetical protein
VPTGKDLYNTPLAGRRPPRRDRAIAMSSELPAFPMADCEPLLDLRDPDLARRLPPLVEAAHGVWSSPTERRRMRIFGFRPATEPGVLKRDWHGLAVRVSPAELVAARPDARLVFRADDRALLVDGQPLGRRRDGLLLAGDLLGLIQAYERWVEAREGRAVRLSRGHWTGPDRRRINAMAETRRLQRLLHSSWRAPPRS